MEPTRRIVELSHVIRAGMVTYPGLPVPRIEPFLTRADSRATYAPGTEFAMDVLTMIGNTGTYLDAPYHRFAGGTDLAGLDLATLVDLPAVLVRPAGRGVQVEDLVPLGDLRGSAVLVHSGDAVRFGTPDYATDPAYVSAAAVAYLVEQGAALVGIDAINIDDVADRSRPAHTGLLHAGVHVVEHLTGLEQLPDRGARFTAVPLRIADFGTISVRAFAVLDQPAG